MDETPRPRVTAADLVKNQREAWERDEAAYWKSLYEAPDPYSA